MLLPVSLAMYSLPFWPTLSADWAAAVCRELPTVSPDLLLRVTANSGIPLAFFKCMTLDKQLISDTALLGDWASQIDSLSVCNHSWIWLCWRTSYIISKNCLLCFISIPGSGMNTLNSWSSCRNPFFIPPVMPPHPQKTNHSKQLCFILLILFVKYY